MMETHYKVLGDNGRAVNGGIGVWPLPHDGHPGAWLAVEPPLIPCTRGLHLCRREDLVLWLGATIWRVEITPEAERLVCEDKIVVSQARIVAPVTTWTERTARLFAADCAERALKAEQGVGREPDARSWAAMQAARDYAEGRLSDKARSAAESAAWSVAWSAARSAAESAAWSVAWSVAESAARSAARSVAWSAARSAAESAAESAARSVAWSAARSAARSAAESGERAWQTDRLFTAYLLTGAA